MKIFVIGMSIISTTASIATLAVVYFGAKEAERKLEEVRTNATKAARKSVAVFLEEMDK